MNIIICVGRDIKLEVGIKYPEKSLKVCNFDLIEAVCRQVKNVDFYFDIKLKNVGMTSRNP